MGKNHNFIKIILLFLAIFFSFAVEAQTDKQILEMVKRNSEEFYYGEGIAKEWDDARRNAMGNLTEQISVNISTEAMLTSESISDGDKEKSRTELKSRINTFTNAIQLEGVKVITLSYGGGDNDADVFCYVERAKVMKLFELRRKKALARVAEGDRFEQQQKISDALESYYYALLLLKSLPHPDTVSYVSANGEKRRLGEYLARHIQEVIDNVQFEVGEITKAGEDRVLADLKVSYSGKPVANCAYRYFGGNGMLYPNIAKDGHGVAEFVTCPDKIHIRVEYEFNDRMKNNFDEELSSIYNNLDALKAKPKFRNDKETATKGGVVNSSLTAVKADNSLQNETAATNAANLTDTCTAIVNRIVKAVQTKSYNSVKQFFTDQGWTNFQQLVTNGNATVIRKPELSFYNDGNVVLCRSIPMKFEFPRSGKVVVENVTLRFSTANAKIESVAFMLNEAAENDILDPSKKWDDKSRSILIQFLEDYQTAYSLKRSDYLDSIFSENALIITGTRVSSAPKMENTPKLKEQFKEKYKYVQSSKSEYIGKLKKIFANNEYVNLCLKDNQVLKDNGQEIYGIQIRQQYSSSRYADEGYLFLLVDLRIPDKPLIHVRTWQPEKDPDFGLFDIHSFNVF